MTLEELRSHLRAAHARIGHEGRFSFTLAQEERETCYLTHWVRSPGAYYETCRTVGVGTVADCLAALDAYARRYRRAPSPREVGRMLGLEDDAEAEPGHWPAAAE